MSDNFNAALPPPYSSNWKQAERARAEDSPRLTSYQAPGGEEIQFILKSFKFSGGQSMDTAEYPFGGLWSNEALNEKTQSLRIEGFIRGAEYIQTRNALVEALRITTDDSAPGYIDFPFWGRFPIVVLDYEISEDTNEKGQCTVTLTFKRAGVSIDERTDSTSQASLSTELEVAVEDLEIAAIESFEESFLDNTEVSTNKVLSQGFGKIKTALLSSLGRIQAAKTQLNTISAEINGITDLVAQNISAPGQLARAQFSAVASIVAGLAEIKNSAASYLGGGSGKNNSGSATGKSSYPVPANNNEKNILLQLFSASDFTLGSIPLTVREDVAQKAIENLYRISAFTAVANILPQLDVSFQKTEGYWKLFQKLEASINKNDPAVYASLEKVRIYVSLILSAKDLSAEKRRYLNTPLPLLYLAQYLGCGKEKLRELNRIADSFVIKGNVLHV